MIEVGLFKISHKFNYPEVSPNFKYTMFGKKCYCTFANNFAK